MASANDQHVLVPFNEFEYIELVAEGGSSKIYKATWINVLEGKMIVAFKELNNSKNINSKELNEVGLVYFLIILYFHIINNILFYTKIPFKKYNKLSINNSTIL